MVVFRPQHELRCDIPAKTDSNILGDRISGAYSDNSVGFQTYSPGDPTLVTRLEEHNVTINARPETDGSTSIFSMWS